MQRDRWTYPLGQINRGTPRVEANAYQLLEDKGSLGEVSWVHVYYMNDKVEKTSKIRGKALCMTSWMPPFSKAL